MTSLLEIGEDFSLPKTVSIKKRFVNIALK